MSLIVSSYLIFIGLLINGNCAQITVRTSFSCESRPSGYYADMETGCQVYHMCDGLGRQFSYSCPNTTLFQQRMLICDHWYMVNCSKSEHDYTANLLIGQRDKPFVEDSENDRYVRTPRPDLLSNSHLPEYNVIYRNGRTRSDAFSLNNVVVAENKSVAYTKPSSNPVPFKWFSSYAENEVKSYSQNETKTKIQYKYNNGVENSLFKKFNNNQQTTTNSREKIPNKSEVQNSFSSTFGGQSNFAFADRRSDTDFSNKDASFDTSIRERAFSQKSKDIDKTLKDLQKFYLIPNYQFPLESVSRPSYDNAKSSFDDIPNLQVDN